MKIEIVSELIALNPKEPILGGIIKKAKIFTIIDGKTTIFPLRFKQKNNKVTIL